MYLPIGEVNVRQGNAIFLRFLFALHPFNFHLLGSPVEHLHLAGDDRGEVAHISILLNAVGLQAPFDEDQAALSQVLQAYLPPIRINVYCDFITIQFSASLPIVKRFG